MDLLPKNNPSGMVGGTAQELLLTRIFDAPRELVFKAWTEPERVARWWGPHGFTNPVCELDVRPGGAMLIQMRGEDGSLYPSKGIYHEVVAPERLVFTTYAFEDEAGNPQLEVLHTITLVDLGDKTKLTLQARVVKSTPEIVEMLAGMEVGWQEGLDRLAESLRSY
jgi:uncharacterized protein YndB with AHSA1/START domain